MVFYMEHTQQYEQEHLKKVQDKLATEIKELNAQLGDKQEEIVRMKKYFWENCNEFDEFGYEHYTNRQMIQNEIDMAEDRMKKRQTYEKLHESPYFACVDFKYEGEKEDASYYIGTASFLPKKAFIPMIFDWRAPISGLFYDFDKGPAEFMTPQGKARGEITHKLQYKIAKGEMEYFFENDMKIDDDILMKELGTNANTRLKSIVATIQKEQNAIIRNENDRILVVQGAAGSGKTSVALHRIAYLLYHKRQELSSDNVMILTPNPIFSDYISQILPELGEEQIVEMSFDEYAKKELGGIGNVETSSQQKEYLLSADTESEAFKKKQAVIAYKQSKEFLEEMYGFVLGLEEELVDWRNLDFRGVKRSEEELQQLFYEKFPETPILNRLGEIADYIIAETETLEGKDMDPIRADLLRDKINAMYRTRNIRELYYEFLQTLSDKTGEEVGKTEFESEEAMIPHEDVYPLLYFRVLLCGVKRHRRIKHLVIDEMQDYTRVQYALLDKLFDCPMTILGDREQVSDGNVSQVLKILPSVFGRGIKILEMKKSYRSTYEIGTYAEQFIDEHNTEFFDRHGRQPQLHAAESREDIARQMAERIKEQQKSYDTIAVICRTQREAIRLHRELEQFLPATLFDEDTDLFRAGVIVAPYYLAKGLEFDAVHVADVSKQKFHNRMHRQVLYIACTRALHELDLYHTQSVSELIKTPENA